ncbi:DUF2971 domain-containing protein [Myroides odoratimimus]|uniref:DUF2971 domain-containing protein n=1 Tax=Myroides odoratimimus CIP 101113 TaxID=883154 RepID=A0AAV3F6M0_9FLAO|nr:DUF2971 domain-containing protein [Myroides odoratimimus]EHO13839.1 hypothetical protein HMPREF9715_00913 [Myroides odoratimimus CIP 101113]
MKYFKYKPINKYTIDSLVFNYYWAASAESMNDVFEGDSVLDNIEKEISHIKDGPKKDNFILENKKLILSTKKTLGLFCLTQDSKNILMWSHYGDSFRGICIEYNDNILAKLKDHKSQKYTVNYKNKIPNISFHKLYSDNSSDYRRLKQTLIGTKAKCWSYEKEIRLIHDGVNAFDYIPEAIEAIYFGYKFPKEESLKIIRALKDQNVKYYKMAKGNYLIKYEELPDIPSFTHYLWESDKFGEFEYNFELENFQKMVAGGKGRLTVFTKEIISEDLANDFYNSMSNGFFKDLAIKEVFFKLENNPINDSMPAYYCFKNNTKPVFTDNRSLY